ncbi:MAG: transposase [Chthoniobacteraceae bacterium]
MQTFDFRNCPIIPAHQLWLAGLLLGSGGRADVGMPRLQAARHPAGDRSSKGEKVPDAWGASGTDSAREFTVRMVSLWAGGRVTGRSVMPGRAATAQWDVGAERLKVEQSPVCGVGQWCRDLSSKTRTGFLGKENTAMSETSEFSRRHDREFKQKTVALVVGGRSQGEVFRDLGVSAWSLGEWIRKARAGHGPTQADSLPHTRAAAELMASDSIETFCNPHRRHSSLGHRSPRDFESLMFHHHQNHTANQPKNTPNHCPHFRRKISKRCLALEQQCGDGQSRNAVASTKRGFSKPNGGFALRALTGAILSFSRKRCTATQPTKRHGQDSHCGRRTPDRRTRRHRLQGDGA